MPDPFIQVCSTGAEEAEGELRAELIPGCSSSGGGFYLCSLGPGKGHEGTAGAVLGEV